MVKVGKQKKVSLNDYKIEMGTVTENPKSFYSIMSSWIRLNPDVRYDKLNIHYELKRFKHSINLEVKKYIKSNFKGVTDDGRMYFEYEIGMTKCPSMLLREYTYGALHLDLFFDNVINIKDANFQLDVEMMFEHIQNYMEKNNNIFQIISHKKKGL